MIYAFNIQILKEKETNMPLIRMPRGGKREGAGRKPKYGDKALEPVTAYLPPDLIEAIARKALEFNIPKNEVMVTSLYNSID